MINESKNVDVLRIMRETVKFYRDSNMHFSADELEQARVAVAELIEASRVLLQVSELAAMLDVLPAPAHANGPIPRMQAILARIGAEA